MDCTFYNRSKNYRLQENLKDKEWEHLLFSYHGIPESHIKISDTTKKHCLKVEECCSVSSEAHKKCYRHQVFKTTELIVQKLNIPKEKYSNAFQSRLPLQPWLKPYTDSELERLPKEGKKKLVIITPAFVTDCLIVNKNLSSKEISFSKVIP